jgi:hypothetical protein
VQRELRFSVNTYSAWAPLFGRTEYGMTHSLDENERRRGPLLAGDTAPVEEAG